MAAEAARARPEMLRVDPVHPDPAGLRAAGAILRHGGLIAYPTETFYGLGVDPFHAEAVARLLAAKGRPASQGLILLVASLDGAGALCDTTGIVGEWTAALARAFWPGPLTLALPARSAAARCPAVAGHRSVAVRVSSHPVARLLCTAAGGPITSTSANLSGRPPASSAQEIDPQVAATLDLVVDGGPTPGGSASTLLDLTAPRPVILRAGPISREAIRDVLGFPPGQAPEVPSRRP